MVEYEKELVHTLDSLGVGGVYIDGFTPEQIFLQIRSKTEQRLGEIETQINKEHKKYKMTVEGSTCSENGVQQSSGSEKAVKCIKNSQEHEEDTIEKNGSEGSLESNATEDLENSEDLSQGAECSESAEERSAENEEEGPGSSEVTELNDSSDDIIPFEEDDWDGEDSEEEEVLSKPAKYVLEMIAGKGRKAGQSKRDVAEE